MPARRKNKRFSTPQRYCLIPNKYRVRDYLTEEWYYVENVHHTLLDINICSPINVLDPLLS